MNLVGAAQWPECQICKESTGPQGRAVANRLITHIETNSLHSFCIPCFKDYLFKTGSLISQWAACPACRSESWPSEIKIQSNPPQRINDQLEVLQAYEQIQEKLGEELKNAIQAGNRPKIDQLLKDPSLAIKLCAPALLLASRYNYLSCVEALLTLPVSESDQIKAETARGEALIESVWKGNYAIAEQLLEKGVSVMDYRRAWNTAEMMRSEEGLAVLRAANRGHEKYGDPTVDQ